MPSDIGHARHQLVRRRVAQDAGHGRIRAEDSPVGRDSPHPFQGVLVDSSVILLASPEPIDIRLESVRHDVEGVCQRPDLVTRSNGDLSFEVSLGHSPCRGHQPDDRAGQELSATDRRHRDGAGDQHGQQNRVSHLCADGRKEHVLRLKEDHRP